MPRRRPLHRYPKEYFALFERAQTGPFVLPFDSPERAQYVRDDLYACRASAREALSLDPDNDAIGEQFLLMENVVIERQANKLLFRVRQDTNRTHILIAQHRAENE